MAEKLEIPVEIKYQFAAGAFGDTAKGFIMAAHKKYGAEAVLELVEMFCKDGDRVKNLTNTILTAFKLEGNDVETIGKWYDIWFELFGYEYTTIERSKTINRFKVTKCPTKTDPKDISSWSLIWDTMVAKTINPKATWETTKSMCAGDPYCEHIIRIEE